MNDWDKWHNILLEKMAEEVQLFLEEVEEVVEDIVEDIDDGVKAMSGLYQEFLEQIRDALDMEMADLYDLLEEDEEDEDWDEDNDHAIFMNHFIVPPTATKNPACIGCNHYHGQMYGGNLLVCGMHPYGWDDANCPDWEQAQ